MILAFSLGRGDRFTTMTARRSEPSPNAIVLQTHSVLPGVLSYRRRYLFDKASSERTPGRKAWIWRTIAIGDGSDRRAVIVVKKVSRLRQNGSILVSYIERKRAKKIRGSATLSAGLAIASSTWCVPGKSMITNDSYVNYAVPLRDPQKSPKVP